MSALSLSSKVVYKPIQALYWIGGSAIIVLAALSFLTQMSLTQLLEIAERLFGISFVLFFSFLVALAVYSIHQIWTKQNTPVWTEVGLQTANGISTLALTYTLLGISLGIGSLASQALTPDTVQGIIGELTAQFSTAFMTTVVGLPTATLVRSIVGVLSVKQLSEKLLSEKQLPEKPIPEKQLAEKQACTKQEHTV